MNPHPQIPKGPETTSPKGGDRPPLPFADRFSLPGGDRIGVLAVSGGADSVALLRCFCALGKTVAVAHLDHRLRGAESAADAEFVRHLAAQLEVPFVCKSVDVSKAAAGDNLEGTARRLRYEFLDRTASEYGAGWVATGHTADDQAETVLMRILRGTGVQGLAGIADGADGLLKISGVPVVRPLLRVERYEVVAYLKSLGQPWREDGSNADRKFSRNRIRHEIFPVLKAESPAVVSLMGGLAEQAAEVRNLLHELAAAALHEALIKEVERTEVRVLRLDSLPANPLVRTEMFRLLWRNACWPMDGMTRGHWKRLGERGARPEGSDNFPGSIRVSTGIRTLVIERMK